MEKYVFAATDTQDVMRLPTLKAKAIVRSCTMAIFLGYKLFTRAVFAGPDVRGGEDGAPGELGRVCANQPAPVDIGLDEDGMRHGPSHQVALIGVRGPEVASARSWPPRAGIRRRRRPASSTSSSW